MMAYNMTSEVACEPLEHALKHNSLIIASGGLDSAYLLWKHAQYVNNIHCYHVIINKHKSKRWQAEFTALNNQINYLKKSGKSVTLYIDEVSVDNYIRDWYTCVLLSLGVVKTNNFDYIAIGDDLPDSYIRNQSFSTMSEAYKKEIKALSNLVYTLTKSKLATAFNSNNLSELYSEMPEDYLKLAFSCRNPTKIYTNQLVVKPCGSCTSCLKNKHFGWESKLNNILHITKGF